MDKKHIDILIKKGQIVTIDSEMRTIENGAIAIEGECIIEVGDESIIDKYQPQKTIDAKNGIVMPGMINTHCHLPMIAFRGLGEEGIQDRLMGYFMPLEKEFLSRDLIYKATIHGCIDMAMSGVTTYADMYYHVDEMAKASNKVGIRSLLGQTVIGFPVADAPKPYGGLEYIDTIKSSFQESSLSKLAIAPHAPYTLSKEKLIEVQQYALKHKLLTHIHVAEFKDEPLHIKDNHKKRSTVEYLDDIGFLGDNLILAHCNHVNAYDLDIIKRTKASIAHNPLANAKGATGMAPIFEAIEKEIPIGLGTDGPMGSNTVDIFKVMTYASTIQRLRKMDRTLMNPKNVVKMATIGGARTLRMEHEIGSLEAGKKADIVIVETNSPNMVPNYNPYATLVFQANPHNVVTTIVSGNIIVEDRTPKTFNIYESIKNINEIIHSVSPFANQLALNVRHKNSSI